MKIIFLILINMYSLSSLACSIHNFKIELNKKQLFKSSSFHVQKVEPANDLWNLDFKLHKKPYDKLVKVLNTNANENLTYLFDKKIVTLRSTPENDLVSISLALTDAEVKALKHDCQSKIDHH